MAPGDQVVASDAGLVTMSKLLEIRRQLSQRRGHPVRTFHRKELKELLLWMACSKCHLRGKPPPSSSDRKAIARAAKQFMTGLFRLRDGTVDADEWIHHMLVHYSPRRTALVVGHLKALTEVALQRQPDVLDELQAAFDAAEPPQPGWLGLAATMRLCCRRLWRFCTFDCDTCTVGDRELGAQDPDDFALEAAEAIGLGSEEVISYDEFMSYFLGRRAQEVSMYMYDISKGNAQVLSRWLATEQLDAFWHTGIVAFCSEYFYSGSLLCAEPGTTAFGVPGRTVYLGRSMRLRSELHRYIVQELHPVFTRDSYDPLQNNCNHFCDRLSVWLCGRHLPADVLHQGDRFLEMPLTRMVWPVVTTCLRGNSFASVISTRSNSDGDEEEVPRWKSRGGSLVSRCCSLESAIPRVPVGALGVQSI